MIYKTVKYIVLVMLFSLGTNSLQADSDSVFLEELTWMEVKQRIADGTDSILIPTGGTEQNGPHMVLGKHNYIVRHAAGEIARRVGNMLVAPVVAYVPQGSVALSGHMKFPGTITLPDKYFVKLIEFASRSFKLHGFKNIILIGDSGGNLWGLQTARDTLNEEWGEDEAKVFYIDRFTRGDRFFEWLRGQGETPGDIGTHAGIMDTSVMMAVDPSMIRKDKLTSSHDFNVTGVVGNPVRASAAYGRQGLEFQIQDSVIQIEQLLE